MINFYKKLCLPGTTWDKKHISKDFFLITYTLEKIVFAIATFGGL